MLPASMILRVSEREMPRTEFYFHRQEVFMEDFLLPDMILF